ncbi:hypothetical protein BaRGS_00010426 [Batillaria attramentaria]|uniref:Uncharacterized protein n=1 Tax=Batillaria attramentaria TaxID=370345 RepID=A0ABD0LG34_9CAEN
MPLSVGSVSLSKSPFTCQNDLKNWDKLQTIRETGKQFGRRAHSHTRHNYSNDKIGSAERLRFQDSGLRDAGTVPDTRENCNASHHLQLALGESLWPRLTHFVSIRLVVPDSSALAKGAVWFHRVARARANPSLLCLSSP